MARVNEIQQRTAPGALTLVLMLAISGCGGAEEAKPSAAVERAVPAAESAANASTAPATAPAEPAAGSGVDLAAGEQIYNRSCLSCHAAGIAGAPKLGRKEDWTPRIAKGLDALVRSTVEGIPPGMPAKGLCLNCSEADLRNAVAWMIAQ